MDDVLNIIRDDRVNIIHVVTFAGPKLTRPRQTFKKNETFTPRFIQKGKLIYTANLFSMNVPCDNGTIAVDMAEHLNGGIMRISYKGINFATGSLSSSGMGTSAVFDLNKSEHMCQRKFCEIGCRDISLPDEIYDIAADKMSCMMSTKMISESIPGELMSEHPQRLINLNSEFVSDIIVTKKIQIVAPGMFDYYIRVNVPAIYSYGTIEVLSSTFFNDIVIQLAKDRKGWEVMKNHYIASETAGFVIAKTPDTAMGVSLLEWPRGAIAFPPEIRYKEFENVNRWGIYQQLGSSKNDSIKLPGGEYSWRIRFFFGEIWRVQDHINKIHPQRHGNDHKKLYKDSFQKKQAKNRHEYAYDCS